MNNCLFSHRDQHITGSDFLYALRELGADQCDVLYIHSGMQFGLPNIGLGKSVILESLADIVLSLDVATLLMPTYSFSFCNDELFDVVTTPSSMGAFNEYLRVKHKWQRSVDPLMSNILHGRNDHLIKNIGKYSIGDGSTFDLLSECGLRVKFLFMGPRLHHCFTYMHYLEAKQKVPYRYDYQFTGTIKNGDHIYKDSYKLFIRDEGVTAGSGAKIYENTLVERGIARMQFLGAGALTVVELTTARDTYLELLNISPNFFIEDVFNNPTQPDTFKIRKMIAL